MGDIDESLRADLSAPNGEFAEGYAESFLNTYVAAQIKTIRQQRGLTQSQLAELLDTTQTVISRIENVNYAGWNIGTLKKLARAFDVRLKVSFEEYGALWGEMEGFSKESLMKAKRTEDPRLMRQTENTAIAQATVMPRSNVVPIDTPYWPVASATNSQSDTRQRQERMPVGAAAACTIGEIRA